MHKETIDKIPAALPGKDSVEVEVYGMEGIPDDAQGSGISHFIKNLPFNLAFSLKNIDAFPCRGKCKEGVKEYSCSGASSDSSISNATSR